MSKVFIISEIGINHNGDLDLAKKMIKESKDCGADSVKFQKRDIDLVYDKETLASKRESPWGSTFREQKEGLEFNEEQYQEIDKLLGEIKAAFAKVGGIENQRFLDYSYANISRSLNNKNAAQGTIPITLEESILDLVGEIDEE